MHKFTSSLKSIWIWIRFGAITEHIVGTAGDNIVSEIEFRDCNGKVIGYWCYGSFDPQGPYQGSDGWKPPYKG